MILHFLYSLIFGEKMFLAKTKNFFVYFKRDKKELQKCFLSVL